MDMPEPDYPAAHSMDTTWYAVDRDGHVAVFWSGEEGAVPEGAGTEDGSPIEPEKFLPEAPFRLMDWLGDEAREQHVELPRRNSKKDLGATLMFLGSIEPIQAEVEAFRAEPAPAAEGVAVFFRELPAETAWRLHEAGACLGCFAWVVPGEDVYYDLWDDRPRRLGLFRYRHADPGLASAYVRSRPPDRPIRIDDIPAEAREIIGRVRFADVRFVEAESIQPVALVPCYSWGDAYLDPDGVTVRPVPGREAEFVAEAWANVPGFRVEVPPTHHPPRPSTD